MDRSARARLCEVNGRAPARQDMRRGAVCRANRQPPVHSLPAPRPLANGLCEALGRHARGSFDFCAVLLKNNTAGLATALEATRAGTSATHQRPIRAAAGRGPSDTVPAAPSRAYLHHGSRIGAEQEHTMAWSRRRAKWLRIPSWPTSGFESPGAAYPPPLIQKRFISDISHVETETLNLILDPPPYPSLTHPFF